MEYLIQYGVFLAKAITIVIAIVFVIAFIASSGSKQKKSGAKGNIRVTKLNEHIEDLHASLQREILDKESYKQENKKKKQQLKLEAKANKHKAKESSSETPKRKKRVYVLNFTGDIAANEVVSLREEITAVLSIANENDEVLLKLESPGGMVHAYGLASSQLLRIKDQKIPLTICVDKVAASGGYMMACLADKLVAAPFAIIGSIGVLVQLPNFHRILKKNDIDYETISAGEFKTTLTQFGEITQKGRDKVKEDVEEMHGLFKRWVKDHRPSVEIDKIATGETWVGMQAKDRYMVDELRTSDECIVKACDVADVYEVEFEHRQSIQEKVNSIFRGMTESVLSFVFERNNRNNFYS